MSYFIRGIGFLIILLCTLECCYSWTIAIKDRSVGPILHTTYFLTPQNKEVEVRASAYVGYFVNNVCQYSMIYDIGKEKIRTGDFVNYNSFMLKDLIGSSYTCATIHYTYQQRILETFQLIWDGSNYYTSDPVVSRVSIL